MPPRKRGRGNATFTPSRARDNEATDADTPTASDVGAKPPRNRERSPHNDMWTDDQVASLFKGVIRWKPAGMHKHFRMIAISEHLRNHGFDPDMYKHTRIPHIWKKLRTYYDLDIIDERELYDNDELDQKYVEFSLPRSDFHGAMMCRAVADASEVPSSPPELDLSGEASPTRKRKRSSTVSKTRVAEDDDSEEREAEEAEGAGEAEAVGEEEEGEGGGGAASQGQLTRADKSDKPGKNDKADTTEEEDNDEEAEVDDTDEEEDEEDGDEDEDGSGSDERDEESPEEEGGNPASRSTRAAARKSKAPKPTARRTRSQR